MADDNAVESEPTYYTPPSVSPLIEQLLSGADEAEQEFLALQRRNLDDAVEMADAMAEGGVPDEKRPV